MVASLNMVGGSIRVKGGSGLAILAQGKISIAGVINATGGPYACTSSSTTNTCAGPGGYAGSCTLTDGLGPSYGQKTQGGTSGSGGGGNGGSGGNGGGAKHGKGGQATGLVQGLLFGGSGGGGGNYGASCGGGGGGAVQLVSSTAIEIKSKGINVGGAGATSYLSGGAGGGAGGTVLLEAPNVSIVTSAVVASNGGGGGGADYAQIDGEHSTLSCTPAKGGKGGTSSGGADGGNGGAGSDISGKNGILGSYNGGGGGGTGRIVINTTGGNASLGSGCVVSPAKGTATVARRSVVPGVAVQHQERGAPRRSPSGNGGVGRPVARPGGIIRAVACRGGYPWDGRGR